MKAPCRVIRVARRFEPRINRLCIGKDSRTRLLSPHSCHAFTSPNFTRTTTHPCRFDSLLKMVPLLRFPQIRNSPSCCRGRSKEVAQRISHSTPTFHEHSP